MVHLELVSMDAAATSSPHRSAFPSLRLMPSPRLLFSPSHSAMTLKLPAPVVCSPPSALVWSHSLSLGPLAIARSAPHVGGSPAPSQSLLPSIEADDEADILAEDEAMADILVEAEFESDGYLDYVTTDTKADRLHGYATFVLLGPNLFLHVSPYGGLVCPICPNHKAYGWIEADARAHVLVRAHAP